MFIDVSEEHAAAIFRNIGKHLQDYAASHPQETALFVVTAVRTSNVATVIFSTHN
jgi:hypothetical protein